MEYDPTRMCELLVGLGDVEVLSVADNEGEPLRVHVRRRVPRPPCGGCGGVLWSDGARPVVLVDLPAFGRPVRLVWHKRRWRCPRGGCEAGSVTEQALEITPTRALLTARAARWATRQAGRGRPLKDVAAELGCVWPPSTLRSSAGAPRCSTPTPPGSQTWSRWGSMRPCSGAGDGSGPRPGTPASSTSDAANSST